MTSQEAGFQARGRIHLRDLEDAMRCISCRRELELAHVWVGSKTICPYCHAVMRVPPATAAQPARRKPVVGPIVRLLIVFVLLAVCGLLVWTRLF
jgi:hypothetical protein